MKSEGFSETLNPIDDGLCLLYYASIPLIYGLVQTANTELAVSRIF